MARLVKKGPFIDRSIHKMVERARASCQRLSPKKTSDTDENEVEFCRLLKEVQSREESFEALLVNPIFAKLLQLNVMIYARTPQEANELERDVRVQVRRKLHSFEPNYTRPYGNFFLWLIPLTQKTFVDSLSRSKGPVGDSTRNESPNPTRITIRPGWESALDLLRKMQTPASRRGIQAAFDTPPTKLGQTAVKHAKKRRNITLIGEFEALVQQMLDGRILLEDAVAEFEKVYLQKVKRKSGVRIFPNSKNIKPVRKPDMRKPA